ncbi:MAG: xylulokinase [Armatimonadota bacterium]|nr:xylulokinase [Armatimonadota bacterium]
MSYLLGIDVGTTSTRALLIDEDGATVASDATEYPLSTPRPNWAEQDPSDWWTATIASVTALIEQSGVRAGHIAGVGLSGQMHGSVFLDESDQVIRPAILWCDQRTARQCDEITEAVGAEEVVSETLNPVLTGFTAPKIIWLRDEEPEAYARVRKVLLPKDYVRLKLTGQYATEVSDASGTSLLNVPRRRWSELILDRLELPRDWLPEVYESPEVSGHVTAEAAGLTGLAEGTPVVGGGGDQAAGAVGNGIVRSGVVSVSTGTSGVVFAHLDEPRVDEKLRTHTFCHAVPGRWHVMGVMLSAGGSLRWVRDTLCDAEVEIARNMGIDAYELMTEQAAQAPVGSEGLVFLPYLTGERTPYPNPNARGMFFGLSLRHGKPHLIRAVLEGVAYGLRDSFEIIEEMGVQISEVRASGGGARSRLWRQIQTDVTGYPHCLINVDEGPAYGVALLAAVGAGLYASVEEACEATIRTVDAPRVDERSHQLYRGYHRLYQQLYRQVESSYDEAARLVEGAEGDT